jgi:acyl-CoA thioesterase FadM
MEKFYRVFTSILTISADMLDELGHANYLVQQQKAEEARLGFCKFLGFSRVYLRRRLGIGLFMTDSGYQYLEELRLGDLMTVLPNITVEGAAKLTITLRAVRLKSVACGDEFTLTGIATYRMVMVNLKTRKPTRIPKEILDSIGRFQEDRRFLMGG